jgi:type I restriction enzyme S subunit
MSDVDQIKLPSGWTLTPVGDLLKFKNGLNKGKAYFGYGTPIVNYMDVFRHAGLRRTDVHGLVDVTNAEKQAFSARKGDILFTRTSETPEEVGISTVLLEDIEDAVFSGFVLRGRPVGDRLTSEFAQYCFESRFVRGQIVSSATYTTRALTNGRILSNVKLPLPDDPYEQQAVAKALSDADGVVAGLERVIAKKRLIKQGTMQDLLTARRRLPGFSGEWLSRPLCSVSSFITKGATPTTYGFGWEAHGILFLRSECVSSRGLDLSQSMFISEEAHRATKRSEVTGGDILITITGNVGRVIRLPNDFGQANINQHIARIRINSGAAIPDFVFHQLSRPEYLRHFNSIVTGQAYPQISLQQVREAQVHFPEIEEQFAIAEFLNDMDSEIQSLESRLAKVRAVKEGMMQNLLTGRVRLV